MAHVSFETYDPGILVMCRLLPMMPTTTTTTMIATMAPREISSAPGLLPDAPAALLSAVLEPPSELPGPVYGSWLARGNAAEDVAAMMPGKCVMVAFTSFVATVQDLKCLVLQTFKRSGKP